MSTNKDKREYDTDEDQQSQDHGNDKQPRDHNKDKQQFQNPERLHDQEHQMDERDNDVEMGGNYGQNVSQDKSDSNGDLESRWNEIESDYRRRYPNLTDDDVNYNSGDFDTMTDRIAKRTNRNREDVNNEIKDWKSAPRNS